MRRGNLGILALLVVLGAILAGIAVWLAVSGGKAEGASGGAGTDGNSLPETALSSSQAAEPSGAGGSREEEAGVLETEPAREDAVLLFAGDVQLSSHVMEAYERAGGIGGVLDERLLDLIRGADFFMVNEEFPFSERGEAADKQYTFRSPPSRVTMLNEMGIGVVTLANNHALDFGTDALLDTCEALEGAGIRYVGAGENLERAKRFEVLEAGGKTVGCLGASRVIPVPEWNAGKDKPGMLTAYDPALLLEEVEKAREACDFLVVYVHWGIERNERPEEYQRTLGRRLIDAGADLVVGSHPHVLQGIEYYQGKPIVYSLGNFVFGSSIPRTALLRAELWEGAPRLSLIPATSGAGYTSQVADPGLVQEFYRYMESISYGVRIDGEGAVTPVEG